MEGPTTHPSLLDQLRQSDQQQKAWDRFARLYTPLLLFWARRQGFNETDAEDLVQNMLTALIKKFPKYQQHAGNSFRHWLFRVAQNECHDFRRRRATRSLPLADGLDQLTTLPSDPEFVELDEKTYQELLVQRAQELIRRDFADKTWAAFTGVMVEGRSAADVATTLNMTQNAVYQARHGVITRLKEILAGFLE